MLGRDEYAVHVGAAAHEFVADGLHEVGLAEAGVTVEEERVVAAARGFGHGTRGGMGKAVARTNDEAVEGVALVEACGAAGRTATAGVIRHGGVANLRGVHGAGFRRGYEGHATEVGGDAAERVADGVHIVVAQPVRKELARHADGQSAILERLEPRGAKPVLVTVIVELLFEFMLRLVPDVGLIAWRHYESFSSIYSTTYILSVRTR